MGILIRTAREEDAKEIREVTLSRVISIDSKEKTGLRGYRSPNIEKYAQRIKNGSVYVAESNQKIIGFMDFYPNKIIHQIFGKDPVANHILNLADSKGDKLFFYLNTAAVLRNYEGKMLPMKMIRKLVEDSESSYKSIWTAVIHKPTPNITSSKLLQLIATLEEKYSTEYENVPYTFGLYRYAMN